MTAMPMAPVRPARAGVAALAINLLAFQAGWFACVLGAARGWAGAGVAVALAVVALYLGMSSARARDALLIGTAMAIGVVWDSAMVQTGWIVYASPGPWPALAPAWIVALWALFATTLRVPMRWLHPRLGLAALLGGVGAPLSYASAGRLGACQFPDQAHALVALAIGWALITPILIALARHLDAPREGLHDA
jgi:hypothetical protein